ncbi:hypothetical protein SAMN05444349_1378 [Bacteroides faecichinchillae]|uniref:Uncharacterized protein n=1 Tax=Bacteroides faecichinchillae TaxID=871325 RepID=A0A1M5EQT1_9BACE|nr:hypothetical protein SAMN05444349_1378 [Bacteroides faecichinchillae]
MIVVTKYLWFFYLMIGIRYFPLPFRFFELNNLFDQFFNIIESYKLSEILY